ncbi:TetR family transcriptional regulator [Streptomyces sp. CA-111067]|uniref:TetR/AcrR family transcriptional regulator n=1 Tax=Streptomyces sp. CA-111067 TaxID=3240046 RepID=UPI003D9593C8
MNDSAQVQQPPRPGRGPGRPAGARAGDTATRDRILDVARELFAQGTYGSTTVRAVALAADVNPALVIHYFGSKHELFAAALQLPLQMRDQITQILQGDPRGLAERLVRFYLGLWRLPASRAPIAAMFRSVFSDQEAADALGRFLTTRILGPIMDDLGHDRPDLRMSLAATQLVGLAIGRHILSVAPLAEADTDFLVACVSPVIQHYLTGPLPATRPGNRGPGTGIL